MAEDQYILYYGVGLNDGLVFIPKSQAKELSVTLTALDKVHTWGELRQNISPRHYQEVLYYLVDGLGVEEPGPQEQFDLNRFSAYQDGDWPEWPAQTMLEWMPQSIQERFGEEETSMLNGKFLCLDPDREAEIVDALTNYGYTCKKDQALIDLAERK